MEKKKYRLGIAVLTLLIIVGGLAYWKIAYGVTRTWDGGGTDGTCGGAGTANNWSCAANWSSDTAPTASDIATFDGTSTKDATINANISVAGIAINAGYTGTITQSGSFTVTVGSSNYSQAAGTFTGGSGAITINGTYTLSGGTFTSTSGTLTVGYSGQSASTIFTVSSGTFNHNNGTVKFVSGINAGSTTYTVDVATSLTLYDIEWASSYTANMILTTAAGDTIIAGNNCTLTDGKLNGSWEVQGNLVIGSGSDEGGGTLSMTGTGSKTYTYSSGGVGPGLTINNASLSVAANTGTNALSIAQFSLLAGTFTAPTGTMTVGRTAPSETTFTVSSGTTFNHNNGKVKFVSNQNSGAQTYTVDVPTTLTLYDVEWMTAYYSHILTTAAGDTLVVANNFTHTDGQLAGAWEVQGNVTIGSGADGGSATLSFTGGNAQTYTDNGGNEPDGDITINKSGGTVTLASNADWNASGQDLTITAGTLAASTRNITTTNFTVNGGTFTGGSGTVTTAGPMLVSSGTFTGGAGNIDVNNVFTLSGGTFTSTSGTLEIGRTAIVETILAISGGTFSHNNGTIAFVPTLTGGSPGTYPVDVSTSMTAYNVVINAGQDNATVAVSAGDTIIISNNFTQTNGRLGGVWEVQGDVIIGSGADGGAGTLTYTGTGSKTYTYSSGGTGPHLRVNNASVSVSAAGGTTALGVNFFSLLAGTFTAPSGTMNVGYTETSTGSTALFTVSGGTFTHNSGTIAFIEICTDCSTVSHTIDVQTALTLNNVIVNSDDNDTIAVAAGDALVASNNFTHMNGILAGTWQIQGNMTIATTADGGSATLTFTGTNDQTYTDQGGNEPNGDITINKSAGTVTLASNADWNATSQDLTITAGTLRVAGTSALSTTALTVGSAGILKMTGTGDLTLAGNVSNSGQIVIESNQSCGGTDDIQILSSSAGVQRTWSGTGTYTIYDATVKDQGGSAAITAYSSTSVSGNGVNWTFSGAACPDIPPAASLGTGIFKLGTGVVNLR